MAKAPKPGHDPDKDAVEQQVSFRFKVRDEEWLVPPPAHLPISEKIAVRSATGLPYESFVPVLEGAIGEDSLVVLYWLGRRGAGERTLTFRRAVDDWGRLDLKLDEVSLDFVNVSADGSPEADGSDSTTPEKDPS